MAIYLQNVVAGEWGNFGEIIAPLSFSKTLKDTVASCTVNIFFEGTDATSKALLLPGDIVRLYDSTTTMEYFVVEDASKNGSSTIDPFSIHTYKLSELVAITRNIYIQTAFFSAGVYTFPEFLTRLTALCKADHTLDFSTAGDYDVALANWQSPDYQVSSNILLDNMFKIGKMLGVRFKATYTPSTDKIYLIMYSLKGSSTITSLGTSKNGSLSQYQASNYASKAVANVENMAVDQFSWFPGIFSMFGAAPEPETDYNSTVTDDTLVIKTPHKIRSADYVRVQGFGRVITDSNTPYTTGDYKFFDLDGDEIVADAGRYVSFLTDAGDDNRNTNPSTYHTFPVVEYREWLLLDPDDSNSATYHQENTLYYKRDENKIFNLKICDVSNTSTSFGTPNGHLFVFKTYYGGAELTSRNMYQVMHASNNRYSVHANFMFGGQIEARNRMGGERATIYSQEENLVSGKSLASNIDGYIDSMTNADETEIYVHDSFATIPSIGDIYNSKVLNTVNYEIEYGNYKVQCGLSDDLVPKSEYVSADAGLKLPAIPVDKAFDRFTNYNTTIWLCKTTTEKTAITTLFGEDTYIADADMKKFVNGAENGRTAAPSFPVEVILRTGESAGNYVYTAGRIATAAVGNTIVMSFKTMDNSLIGYFVDKTAGTDSADLKFYPVTFINSTGECTGLSFKILYYSFNGTATNYPAISSANYDGATTLAVVDDSAYYHDPAETVNVNYSIVYKGYDVATKIYQAFLEECNIFKDNYSQADSYTRYIEYNSTTVEITSVTYTASGHSLIIRLYFSPTGAPASGDYAMKVYRTADAGATKEYLFEMTTTLINSVGTACFYLVAGFTK